MNGSGIVCILAAMSVGAGLLGLRWRGRFERVETPAAGVPAWLTVALSRARAFPMCRSTKLPQGAARHLTRQLARAGLSEWIDASTWVAALAFVTLVAVVSAALLWAWLSLSPLLAAVLPLMAAVHAQSWLARRARARTAELERELPVAIDLLVLCLESGASLGAAIRIAHEKSSRGAIRDLFAALLFEIRSGQDRATAFCSVRDRLAIPAVSGVLTALIQADSRGMSLGPALRAQSAQCIADRFVRAERAAMQAPVRLLFPLLAFIFPCTFIVIAVPIAARLISGGGP